MQTYRWAIASALLALTFVALPAAADDATLASTNHNNREKGYEYAFGDDPLQAAGLEPLGARIQVARGAARATLIRPRTAFVTELLKSVEHL